MVANTAATETRLSHSTSFNWLIINIPTITRAHAVTGEVNRERMRGEKTIAMRKNIPVNTAVSPVLPPTPIPVELST